MGNWKTERDALVSETLAFVRSVRSQARRHDVLEPMPHSGDEKGRSQSATFDDRVKPASDDPAVLSRLTPMNWGQPEREEIIQRVARFKAHQQLFTRERENFAVTTLAQMKVTLGQVAEHLVKPVSTKLDRPPQG